MNRLSKTKSVVFLNWRFSLFLKEAFFPDFITLDGSFELIKKVWFYNDPFGNVLISLLLSYLKQYSRNTQVS